MKFSVAIVTYKSEPTLLAATLQSLLQSVATAQQALPDLQAQLYIIENDTYQRRCLQLVEQLLRSAKNNVFVDVSLSASQSNVGFGGGHNQAIDALDSDIHLILNPDVELAEDAVLSALQFLARAPEVGLVSPHGVNDDNSHLYLCKRYPTVLDLFVRGFLPQSWQRPFASRLARYEMHEVVAAQRPANNIEIASGCCMFVRTALLKKVGGFNDDYFLYFEDFDLSLRIGQFAGTSYAPSVKIVHHGGNAARKGWRHILLFARSGFRFFQQHGWRWI